MNQFPARVIPRNYATEHMSPEAAAIVRGCYVAGWSASRTAAAIRLTVSTVQQAYSDLHKHDVPRWATAQSETSSCQDADIVR